ncbi:MAG: FecR domain-containing protein [Tannerellaceae bacterium]|jgi:ferric-dicitrate binding protein FerR (iron transport regulator)|nr:FecR domain-containing protein [Tannerellaceae bacterium]
MDKADMLIIKYLSKSASSCEQSELLEWLEMSEDNKVRFRSFKDAYDLWGSEADMKVSDVKFQWIKFACSVSGKTKKQAPARWCYTPVRYAAIFLAGVLLSYFIYSHVGSDRKEELYRVTKIETGIGERSKVTLPDGSTVWINACSSISFDNSFGDEVRSVLLNGEAYFDVQTDSLKPFLVHVDKFTHRVTGTSFNVYSFGDENQMSIALLEGKVSVEYDKCKKQLLPGEMITYDKSTGQITCARVDVRHISSWRDGEYTFDDLTFEDLSKRLERMYDVRFVFDNKLARQMRFGGTLRSSYSLETIMKVIKTSVPITYTINENTVHIY